LRLSYDSEGEGPRDSHEYNRSLRSPEGDKKDSHSRVNGEAVQSLVPNGLLTFMWREEGLV